MGQADHRVLCLSHLTSRRRLNKSPLIEEIRKQI